MEMSLIMLPAPRVLQEGIGSSICAIVTDTPRGGAPHSHGGSFPPPPTSLSGTRLPFAQDIILVCSVSADSTPILRTLPR